MKNMGNDTKNIQKSPEAVTDKDNAPNAISEDVIRNLVADEIQKAIKMMMESKAPAPDIIAENKDNNTSVIIETKSSKPIHSPIRESYDYKKDNIKEYQRIIETLRARRIRKNITQQTVADKSGVSFTNISAIERGVQVCSAVTLIGYIRAVEFSYSDLDKDAPFKDDYRRKYINPKLLDAIEDLSEVEQEKLLNMIKMMF